MLAVYTPFEQLSDEAKLKSIKDQAIKLTTPKLDIDEKDYGEYEEDFYPEDYDFEYIDDDL